MKEFDCQIAEIIDRARVLGTRTAANGALLVGHVPHVAPEGWLHELHPPLSSAEIEDLEARCALRFPPEFQQFLLVTNGAMFFSCSLSIYGKRHTHERTGDSVWQPFDIVTPNTIERTRDADAAFLFVGSYRSDGSRLYIDTRDERVFRCEKRNAEPLNQWATFKEMLRTEVIRISFLYDNTGRRSDPDKPTTP